MLDFMIATTDTLRVDLLYGQIRLSVGLCAGDIFFLYVPYRYVINRNERLYFLNLKSFGNLSKQIKQPER
jgi:hypothetical protein